jgi:hypothetical protein
MTIPTSDDDQNSACASGVGGVGGLSGAGSDGEGSLLLSKREPSITMSLRGNRGDNIVSLYDLAKELGVAVTSIFRQNLLLYDHLLAREEENMSVQEKQKLGEIVHILALSHLVRIEGLPNKDTLVEHMLLSGKDVLAKFITNSTPVRLFLIVDRARAQAARINHTRFR